MQTARCANFCKTVTLLLPSRLYCISADLDSLGCSSGSITVFRHRLLGSLGGSAKIQSKLQSFAVVLIQFHAMHQVQCIAGTAGL